MGIKSLVCFNVISAILQSMPLIAVLFKLASRVKLSSVRQLIPAIGPHRCPRHFVHQMTFELRDSSQAIWFSISAIWSTALGSN